MKDLGRIEIDRGCLIKLLSGEVETLTLGEHTVQIRFTWRSLKKMWAQTEQPGCYWSQEQPSDQSPVEIGKAKEMRA